MRFGVCTPAHRADIARAHGYDYIEMPLGSLSEMSEEAFKEAYDQLSHAGIASEAFNCFFTGPLNILSPDPADIEAVRTYSRNALARAARLGGKIAVIGSGDARRRPEGVSQEEFDVNFIRLMNMLGDEAAKVGMTVVVEPLNANETNTIITVAEGLELTKRVAHPNVRSLADFFHMFKNGETLEAVEQSGGLLAHVHIARASHDRGVPRAEDAADLARYAAALKKCGYNGRLSIEATYRDFENEIAAARSLLEVFN